VGRRLSIPRLSAKIRGVPNKKPGKIAIFVKTQHITEMNALSFTPLTALSPLDGRYQPKVAHLSAFFSEFGLIHHRVIVEIEYFAALCDWGIKGLPQLSEAQRKGLKQVASGFSEADAQKVKVYERTTNHDVKAVEYFVKDKLEELGLGEWKEFVHFGLTSQDVNNTAIPLSLRLYHFEWLIPSLQATLDALRQLSIKWQAIPMLAHTHGQPASPTTLGKEMAVFAYRLEQQLSQLLELPIAAKFGGATGNFNAHLAAYPEVDWLGFANEFVEKRLGLKRSKLTTQIENYDALAAYFDNLKRICIILTDFSRDVWQYISMGYFKQKVNEQETGSSAMPHKVNPIDFENAEGNLGMAHALLGHLSAKLPISRLQRDLTDSTVLRNIGMPLGYLAVALASLEKGMGKLALNADRLEEDLEKNWAVVAEAIQTVLRREGYPKPYEALKSLTRGKKGITQADFAAFISSLDIKEAVKQELLAFSPHNYIGYTLDQQWKNTALEDL